MKDVKSDERRGQRRFQVEGVRGKLLFTTDAKVTDMSLDGMAIETGTALKVGRTYELKVEEHGHDIPILGNVVWCTLVKTVRTENGDVQPIFRAGVHFENLLSSRARDLRQFIRENAVISLGSRLFGRFRIEPKQSADLSFEADFRVLQLSRTGMLVETDIAVPLDTSCRMRIRFPGVEFEATSRITRVERVEQTATGGSDEEPDDPLVILEVEFLDLDPEIQEDLQTFIEREMP